MTTRRRILRTIAGLVGALVAACIVGVRLANPALTDAELFARYWLLWLVLSVAAVWVALVWREP
jgi:hypothetical protein